MDLLKAATELYGDCSQEANSTDVYINGKLPTAIQMDEINNRAVTNALATRRIAKLSQLTQAYDAAIQRPVAYMDTSFQADTISKQVLTESLVVGVLPTGFAWLDTNNVSVPMTFVDLRGLANTVQVRGNDTFWKLQGLKDRLRNAATVDTIDLIVWA